MGLEGNIKRKIIKQGHNTLTITLPSDWTKKLNLQAGKEVELLEKNNGLFITAEKGDENRKAVFDITGMDIPTIWKYFMATYREGYDEILVRFLPETRLVDPYKFFIYSRTHSTEKEEKVTALQFVYDLINRFIGLEVIDYGKDFVLIKELSEPSPKEFDNSLRRIFLLLEQMADETCEAIKTNNPKIIMHMHDVDVNLDKFHDYCIRILNKTGNSGSRRSELLFSTIYLLELVGDEFKNIAHHLIHDFPRSEFRNINEMACSVKEQLGIYYNLFYKFDKEKAIKISNIDSERYFNVLGVYKKTKSDNEKEIFHHLRIITRYINALLELRIEMEF